MWHCLCTAARKHSSFFFLGPTEALELAQEIPSGSLRTMRKQAKETDSLQIQCARRLNKALHHIGIHADTALPQGCRPGGSYSRPRDLLLWLPVRIYSTDEEKSEGKALHIRMYGAKERAIKKRDGHHRRNNDDILTVKRTGYEGVMAAVKILAKNNAAPFDSGGFGDELADCGYLNTFGPDTAELLAFQ